MSDNKVAIPHHSGSAEIDCLPYVGLRRLNKIQAG